MKKINCCLLCINGEVHLHIGYVPRILPEDKMLYQSFKVSDVYLHVDSSDKIFQS